MEEHTLPTSELFTYHHCLSAERDRTSTVGGRDLFTETESDRGRIIQSAALRRLQQKTQVYPLESNAAVRTRLTHSLEVMQTGRFIAHQVLAQYEQQAGLAQYGLAGQQTSFLNLVEMACLLHDIGNPPFGHFGEQVLNEWLARHLPDCYRKACGNNPSPLFKQKLLPDLLHFEGNAQAIRILHSLQQLNLTYSQLAAVIKYPQGAWQRHPSAPFSKKTGYFYSELPLIERMQTALHLQPAQRHPLVFIMEAADDIAYCIADLEDAVDKKVLSLRQLQEALKTEWRAEAAADNHWLVDIIESAAQGQASAHAFITQLRTQLVNQLVPYAAQRYCQQHQAIMTGQMHQPIISGDANAHRALNSLKRVARKYVFNSFEVQTPEIRGYHALTGLLDIFRVLLTLPVEQFTAAQKPSSVLASKLYQRLATRYKDAYQRATAQLTGESARDLEWYYRVRLVLDYLSGMTDHFVVTEYQILSGI